MANPSLLKPLGMTGLGEPIASAPADPDPVTDNPYPSFSGWRLDALGIPKEDAITREQGFDYMKMFRSQQTGETNEWTAEEEADVLSAQFEFNQRHGLLTDREQDESVEFGVKINELSKESRTLRNNDFLFRVIDSVEGKFHPDTGWANEVGTLRGLHEKGEMPEETPLTLKKRHDGTPWPTTDPNGKPIPPVYLKTGNRAELERKSDVAFKKLLNDGSIPFAKLSDGEIYYGPDTARPENLEAMLKIAADLGYIDDEDRHKISRDFEIVEGSNDLTVVALKRERYVGGVLVDVFSPDHGAKVHSEGVWEGVNDDPKEFLLDSPYAAIEHIMGAGGSGALDEHLSGGEKIRRRGADALDFYIENIKAAIFLHDLDVDKWAVNPDTLGSRYFLSVDEQYDDPNKGKRETIKNIHRKAEGHHSITDEEITNWIYKQVLTREASAGVGDFAEFDEDNPEKSLVRFGPNKREGNFVLHPKVLLRNEAFDALLDSTSITDYEKEKIKHERTIYYDQLYEVVNNAHQFALASGDVEVWEAAKLKHAVENGERDKRGEEPLSDGEFLRSLVNDPDYYDAYDTKWWHVGKVVVDGFVMPVGFLAANFEVGLTKEEFANYGQSVMNQQQSRRLISATFGRTWLEGEMGAWMTFGEVLIPLVADLALGAIATIATGGVGGVAVAGYTASRIAGGAAVRQTVKLAAKAGIGAKRTATLAKEAARVAADGPAALGNNLLKNAAKSASGKAVIDAGVNATVKQVAAGGLKPFWKTVGGSFTSGKLAVRSHKATRVIAGAMAPAFARSASSHYIDAYSSLPSWMSHEEKHAKAMGVGLVGGAITAILTGGFSAFGAGGLERILEHKAGGKIIGQVLGKLRQHGGSLGHVESKAVVMRILDRSIRNNQVFRRAFHRFAPDALFEGLEEALDTLISSPVIDKMLRRRTDWGVVLEEAMMSFFMGALISGVAGGGHAALGGVFKGDTKGLTAAYHHQKAQSLLEALEKEGSPLTAKEFKTWTEKTLVHGPADFETTEGVRLRRGKPSDVEPTVQPRRGEEVPEFFKEMAAPILSDTGLPIDAEISPKELRLLEYTIYKQTEREEKVRHFDRYRRMQDFVKVERAILMAAQQAGISDVTQLDINSEQVQALLPSVTAQEDIDAAKIDPDYNVTDSGKIIGVRNPARKAGEEDWVGVAPTTAEADLKRKAYRASLPADVRQGRVKMEQKFEELRKSFETKSEKFDEELDALIDQLEENVSPESVEGFITAVTRRNKRNARLSRFGRGGIRNALISAFSDGDDGSVVTDPAILAEEDLKRLPEADTIANEAEDVADLNIPTGPMTAELLVESNLPKNPIPPNRKQTARQLDVDAKEGALAEEAEARDTNPTGQKDPTPDAGSPSDQPGTSPPRATSPAPPRPPSGKGRSSEIQPGQTMSRLEWDAQYGEWRAGGRTHNHDGSPYQPTVFDEVMLEVNEGLRGATDEVARFNAYGDSSPLLQGQNVKRLLNDGWKWDAKQNRFVNPNNPSETPANGIARIWKELDAKKAAPKKKEAAADKAAKKKRDAEQKTASKANLKANEFIDDNLSAEEITAFKALVSAGVIVELASGEHGLPVRKKYPSDYYTKKTNLLEHRINKKYPKLTIKRKKGRAGVKGKDGKVVRKADGTVAGHIEDGIGVFNNDPETVAFLFSRGIPVRVPPDFKGLNPSIIVNENGLVSKVLIGGKEVSIDRVHEPLSSPKERSSRILSLLELFYQSGHEVSEGFTLYDVAGNEIPTTGPVTVSQLLDSSDNFFVANSDEVATIVNEAPEEEGRKKLSKSAASYATVSAQLEAKLELHLFSLRNRLIQGGHTTTETTKQGEEYLAPTDSATTLFFTASSMFEEYSTTPGMLFGPEAEENRLEAERRMARVIFAATDVQGDPDAAPKEVLKSFLKNHVLNNRNFTGGVVPSPQQSIAKTRNFYQFLEARMTRESRIKAWKAAFSPLDESSMPADKREFSGLVDPIKAAALPKNTSSVLIGLTESAVNDIRTNSDARGRLNSFLTRYVYGKSSEDFVESLSADNAVGVLFGWATSSPNDNADLNTFYDYLESQPDNFGNNALATLLRLYWTGSDAHLGPISEDTRFLQGFANIATTTLKRPTPLTGDQIAAAVAAIRASSVEYFSHSYASGLNLADIIKENLNEIDELGLIDNDPESVLTAFSKIEAESDNEAHRLAARILLKSPEFVKTVKLSIRADVGEFNEYTRNKSFMGVPAGMMTTFPVAMPYSLKSVGFLATDEEAKRSPGFYGAFGHRVTLFVQGHSGDTNNIATTLLHEYLHAFTSNVWQSTIHPVGTSKATPPYTSIAPEQQALMNNLDSIRMEVKAALEKNNLTSKFTTDALRSTGEFVTHLFTSRNFQSTIASLPPIQGELPLLKRALNFVFDVINLGIQYLKPTNWTTDIESKPLFKPTERDLYAEAFENMVSFVGSVQQPVGNVWKSAHAFTYGMAERTDEFLAEASDIYAALQRTVRGGEPTRTERGLLASPDEFAPMPPRLAAEEARAEEMRKTLETALLAQGERRASTAAGTGGSQLTAAELRNFSDKAGRRLSRLAQTYDMELELIEPGDPRYYTADGKLTKEGDFTGRVRRSEVTGEVVVQINLLPLINELTSDRYFQKNRTPSSLLIDAIFAEEVIHHVAIEAIPSEVFDALIADTTLREFADIAKWYHGDEKNTRTNKTYADETIEQLESDDPNVSTPAKRVMMDEFLRMQVQKRVKGMTTEETRQHFRGVDALVSPFSDNKNISRKEKSKWRKSTTILWGMKNAYRRYVVYNKFSRNNPRFKKTIDTIVDEITAMEKGYRYNPGKLQFNPANPADTLYAVRDQLANTSPVFSYETTDDKTYRDTITEGDKGGDNLNDALKGLFSVKQQQEAMYGWFARNPKSHTKLLEHIQSILERAGFAGSTAPAVILDKNGDPVMPSERILPSEGEVRRSSVVAAQIESDRARYRFALNGDKGDDPLQEHITTALNEINEAFESGEEIRWKGVALGEYRIFGPQQFWKRHRDPSKREVIRQLDLPYPADPDMVHQDWFLPELEEGQEDLTLEQYKEFLDELPEGDPRKSYDLDGAMERFRKYVKHVVTERALYDTRRNWEVRNPKAAKALREVLDYEYLHKGHTKLSTLELKNANDLIAARDRARADLAFSRGDIGHDEARRLNKYNWDSHDVGYLHWWHGYRGYPYEGNLHQHVAPGAEGREWASLTSSENFASYWGPEAYNFKRRHLSFGYTPADRKLKAALKMLTPGQKESLDSITQEFLSNGFEYDEDHHASAEEHIVHKLMNARGVFRKGRDLARLDAAGDIDRFLNKTLTPSQPRHAQMDARIGLGQQTKEVAGDLFLRLSRGPDESHAEFRTKVQEFRARMSPVILGFLRNFGKNRFTISIGGKEFNASPTELIPYYAKPTKASFDFSASKSDAEIIKNVIEPYYDGREKASRRVFNQIREVLSSVGDPIWDEFSKLSVKELSILSRDSYLTASTSLKSANPHPFYTLALQRVYFDLNVDQSKHFTYLDFHEITGVVAAGKNGWEAALDAAEEVSNHKQAGERAAGEVDHPSAIGRANLLAEFKKGNYRMWESHFFLDELKAEAVRMQEYEGEAYRLEPVNLYVKPGLLKSGYAVTFDDNGQIIDPEHRMDFTKDDIRFSSVRANTEAIDGSFLRIVEYGDAVNGGDNLLKQLKQLREAGQDMAQPIIDSWKGRNPVSMERLRLMNEAAGRAGDYTLTRNEYISNKGDDPVPVDDIITTPLGDVLLPFARFRVEEVPLSEQELRDYKEGRGELAEQKKLAKIMQSYEEDEGRAPSALGEWLTETGDEFRARAPSGIFGEPDSPFVYGLERHPLLGEINTKAEVKDAREWKQVGKQLGSNKGGVFEDENGTKHYFKEGRTPDHARNEVLASILYETAGAQVVPLRLAIGKNEAGEDVLGTASEWREGLRMLPRGENVLREAYKDFAAHAWLANWDVVGTGYDNLLLSKEGKPVHVDPGGALQYRAQGAPKGENWNDEASEFESLRSRGTAGEIFGRMTHDDIKNSTKQLFRFSDFMLRQVVDSVFKGGAESEALADTLITRRKNIIKKAFNVSDAEAEAPVLRSSISLEQDTKWIELAQDENANADELLRMDTEAAEAEGYTIEGSRYGSYSKDGLMPLPSPSVNFAVGYFARPGFPDPSSVSKTLQADRNYYTLDESDPRLPAGAPPPADALTDRPFPVSVTGQPIRIRGEKALEVFASEKGFAERAWEEIEKRGLASEFKVWRARERATNKTFRKLRMSRPRETESDVRGIAVSTGLGDPSLGSFLFEHGLYDTLIIHPGADPGGVAPGATTPAYSISREQEGEIVVRDPNQVKWAGVARDAAGNVVPLSERYNRMEPSVLQSSIRPDFVANLMSEEDAEINYWRSKAARTIENTQHWTDKGLKWAAIKQILESQKVPASELKSLIDRGLATEFDPEITGEDRLIKKEEVLEFIAEEGLKVMDVEYSGRIALQKALDTGKITAVDLVSQNLEESAATHLVLGPVLPKMRAQGLIGAGDHFSPESLEARTLSTGEAVGMLEKLRIFLETKGQLTTMKLTDLDRAIFEDLRIRSASNLISSSSLNMLHTGLEQIEQSQRQVVGPATSINEFLLRVSVAIDHIANFERDNPDIHEESIQHIGDAYVQMYSRDAIPDNPAAFNWHEHAADVANHRAEFDYITPLRNYIRDYERMAQRGAEDSAGIEPGPFLDIWQPSVEPDGSLQFNEEVAHALLERYYEAAEAEEDIYDTGLVQAESAQEDIEAGITERYKIDWKTSSLVDSVTGDIVVHGVVEGHSPLDPRYEPTAEELDNLDQMAIGAAQEEGAVSPDQPLDLTEAAAFTEWNEGLPPDPDSVWNKAQFKSYIMESGYDSSSDRTNRALRDTAGVPYKTILITVRDDNTRTDKPHFGREVNHPDEHIVAHVRITERRTLDGKLALHIEEIQSDWASATRTLLGTSKNLNGFVGLDMEAEGMLGAMDAAKNLLQFEDAGVFIPGSFDGLRSVEVGELMSKYEGVPRDQITGANKTSRMPKRFADKYTDIALKRIAAYAVKAGKYDYITFPTGAQVINTFSSSAERFNPSEATWEVVPASRLTATEKAEIKGIEGFGREVIEELGVQDMAEDMPESETPYVKIRMLGSKAGMRSAVIFAPLHKENDGITVEYTLNTRPDLPETRRITPDSPTKVLVSPDSIKEQASKIPIEVRKKMFAKMASIQKSGMIQVYAYHGERSNPIHSSAYRNVDVIEMRRRAAETHEKARDKSATKLRDTLKSLYKEFGADTVENFRKLTYMMTAWESHLDRLNVAQALSGEGYGSSDRPAYTTRAQLEGMVGPEILDFIEKEYKGDTRNGQLVADKDGNGKPVKMTSKELKRWSGPPISKPEHDEHTGDVIMDERDIGKVPLLWGGRLHNMLYGTMLPAGLSRALGVKEGKGRNTLSPSSGATGQLLENFEKRPVSDDLFQANEVWFRREYDLSDEAVMVGLGGDPEVQVYAPVSSVDLSVVSDAKADGIRGGISLFSSVKNVPTDQSHIPLDIGEMRTTNHGRTFNNLLQIPFYHTGDYVKPLMGSFAGEIDPRLRRLDDNRSAFQRTVGSLLKTYKKKLDKHLKKSFGSLEEVPSQMLADAIGSTEGVMLSEDDASAIEDAYQKEIESIVVRQQDGSLSPAESLTAYKLAQEDKIKKIHTKELAIADSINARKVRSLRDLAKMDGGEDLVKHIVSLRNLLDDLSKKVKGLYNLSPTVEAHFDANMGIYLTRAYKMFTESDYGRRVLEDTEFLDVREKAADFFKKQYRVAMVETLVGTQKLSHKEANDRVDAELRKYEVANGTDLGMDAAREYVESFEFESSKAKKYGEASMFRPMIENLKRKKAVAPALRALLGEYDESTNLDNLFRTITTVGNMASNQAFLRHAATIGRESNWLFTKPELDKLIDKARESGDTATLEKLRGYIPVRGREAMGGSARSARHDPFTNHIDQDGVNVGELFGPPELRMGLEAHFAPMTQQLQVDTAESRMKSIHKWAARFTGLSMAAKTLGSPGFYLRNALSNMLFFAPMQGLPIGFGTVQLFKEMSRELAGADMDNYRLRLSGLGIIGDDVNTSLVSDLINGVTSEEGELEKMEKLLQKAESSIVKGRKAVFDIPLEKAKQISMAIDAAHKIAYFEHELKVLKRARDLANSTSDGSVYQGRTDEELDRLAAKNILMTSQSYSQTMPIVKQFQKSGVSLIFSPFIRFKTEVPRITYNTFKLAIDEMKSGNSVIAMRGAQRFGGAVFTIGGLSIGASLILKSFLGYEDEEDQAARAGVPEYSRGHTFFFFEKKEAKVASVDLTFVNPFAVIVDPFLRGFEHLIAGRPEKIAGDFLTQMVFETFADEQILWGTVRRAFWDNVDPTSGDPVYEPNDDVWDQVNDLRQFIYRDAFEPKGLRAILDSASAIGKDYEDWEFTSLGRLAAELRPFKVRTLKPDKMFKRYLGEQQSSYGRIRNKKSQLLNPNRRFSEGEIRDVVRSEYKSIRNIHDDINKKIRGYEGLGLPNKEAFSTMKGMKVSTERLHMLNNQATGRINPSENFLERMLNDEGLADEKDDEGNIIKEGLGSKRLRVFIDEFRKLPGYDPIPSKVGDLYLKD